MATQVQDFQAKLKETTVYGEYQEAVNKLKSDPNAYQLLQELISLKQNSSKDPQDLVALEQDIERCEPLHEYFRLERKYLEVYNRLSQQVFGQAAIHCGPLGKHDCSSCQQGCHK